MSVTDEINLSFVIQQLDAWAEQSGDPDIERLARSARHERPGRKPLDDEQHVLAAVELQHRRGISESSAFLHMAGAIAAQCGIKPDSVRRRLQKRLHAMKQDPYWRRKLDELISSNDRPR